MSDWGGVDSQMKVSVEGQSFLFRRFVNRRDHCFRLLNHLCEIQRDGAPIFGSFLYQVRVLVVLILCLLACLSEFDYLLMFFFPPPPF